MTLGPDLVGKRIRLLAMPDDPCPVEVGAEGTVTGVHEPWGGRQSIGVQWDNGRTLYLCCPPDVFEVVG